MRKYDYLMRTRALCLSANTVGISEQEIRGMSKTDLAVSPRQTVPKKYPRAPGDIPPPHKSAHNDILCTDSKGNQAKQDKPAGRSLAAVLLCFCPLCCFWRSALTEQGAKTIAYNQSKNESKRNKRARKKRNRQAKTERANKHKQESLQACLLL